MPEDVDRLAARVAAVERALTDGETDLDRIADRAALDARVEDLETSLETLTARLDELEAAVKAVRGFAGGVRAVNRDVERRADLALATVAELDEVDGEAVREASSTPPGCSTSGGDESSNGSGDSSNGSDESPPVGDDGRLARNRSADRESSTGEQRTVAQRLREAL
jgi:chromosome segregation ATPase